MSATKSKSSPVAPEKRVGKRAIEQPEKKRKLEFSSDDTEVEVNESTKVVKKREPKIDKGIQLLPVDTVISILDHEAFGVVFDFVNTDTDTGEKLKPGLPNGSMWFQAVGAAVIGWCSSSDFNKIYSEDRTGDKTKDYGEDFKEKDKAAANFAREIRNHLGELGFVLNDVSNATHTIKNILFKNTPNDNMLRQKHVDYVLSGLTSFLVIQFYGHRPSVQPLVLGLDNKKYRELEDLSKVFAYFEKFCQYSHVNKFKWQNFVNAQLKLTPYLEDKGHNLQSNVINKAFDGSVTLATSPESKRKTDNLNFKMAISVYESAIKGAQKESNIYAEYREKSQIKLDKYKKLVDECKAKVDQKCEVLSELAMMQTAIEIEKDTYQRFLNAEGVTAEEYSFKDYLETLAQFHQDCDDVAMIHKKVVAMRQDVKKRHGYYESNVGDGTTKQVSELQKMGSACATTTTATSSTSASKRNLSSEEAPDMDIDFDFGNNCA